MRAFDTSGEKAKRRRVLKHVEQAPAASPIERVLRLQQSHGNVAVQRMIQRDVDMEPTAITAPRGQYNIRANQTLWNVVHRASINALIFAQQVESACEAFRNYAEPKCDDLEDEISAGDLLNVLLSVALAPVGGAVTGRIANAVAQALAEAVVSQITDAITEKASEAAGTGDEVDDLRNAIRSLAQGARDAATGIQETVRTTFEPQINTMIQKLNSGEALSSDENEFLGTFWMAPPDLMDENLESFCGIPSTASAQAIHLRIFRDLVRKFEEQRIFATNTWEENFLSANLDMLAPNDPRRITNRARRAASEAEAQRRRELESRRGR